MRNNVKGGDCKRRIKDETKRTPKKEKKRSEENRLGMTRYVRASKEKRGKP